MPQDPTYQTSVYHQQGGNKLVATSDGIIEVQSAGVIDISTEGILNIQSGGLFRALSEAVFSTESSFDFFNLDTAVTGYEMRNFLMRLNWSIIVHSVAVLSEMGGSSPPVLPSRMGYIILSIGALTNWSARLCSGYRGQELTIMVRGTNNTSGFIFFSAGTSALNISGVNVVGKNGANLTSIAMYTSFPSFAMIKLLGIDDAGSWAVIDTGHYEGDTVVQY